MKKIVLFIVITSVLSGCIKDLSDIQNDDDLIPVKLSFSGEVSSIDEPLSKSEDSDYLFGIQVYQGESPYARGLFDNVENLIIYLHSDKQYSIKCQLIKNGKKTLYCFDKSVDATVPTYILTDSATYTETAGSSSHPVTITKTYWKKKTDGPYVAKYNGRIYSFHKCSVGYGEPFDIADAYSAGGHWVTSYYEKNRYHYEDSYYSGWISSCVTVSPITNSFEYSTTPINISNSDVSGDNEKIDRYYGESGTFTATPGSNSITLNMKHLVYGLQCNVTGVTDGTASITVKNGDKVLLNKTDISGEYHSDVMVFAFSDMHSAWQYSDNYTENITISMQWLRGVGVLQDLGSQVVQVKRNSNNVINVSLNAIQ